jgi:hypothetical protein
MLHALLRRGAAVCTGPLILLFAASLLAGNATPVGTLHCNGDVFVGGEAAHSQAVLYSGDQVNTLEGRATISLTRGDLMVMGRQSTADLQDSPYGYWVGLKKGQFAWTVSGQRAVRVEADGLTLSPAGSFPSLAQVALRGDGSLTIAVLRGKVSVADLRAEPIVVSAGQVLTVSPRLAQGEQSKPVGTGAHGKMTLGEKLRTFRIGGLSHNVSAALVVGVVGAATATAIAVPLTVGTEPASPSAP